MIIPSQTQWQTGETLADTLDDIWEKALAEIPLRVIPVVPQGVIYADEPSSRSTAASKTDW